jgi:hypothetical protein
MSNLSNPNKRTILQHVALHLQGKFYQELSDHFLILLLPSLGNAPPCPKNGPVTDIFPFVWGACHKHWHFPGYAKYTLLNTSGTEIAGGVKNGFCLLDYTCPAPLRAKYTCSKQGLQAGCSDIYSNYLGCQWLDITSLPKNATGWPQGTYDVCVEINAQQKVTEVDYTNNRGCVRVDLATLGRFPYSDTVAETYARPQSVCRRWQP